MLTKEQADLIVDGGRSRAFRKKFQEINGRGVAQYNYSLANFQDFSDPLGDGSLQAFEMRGLTFVEQDDGSWKRFLHLHKFFNLNQTTRYMLGDVRDKTVRRVSSKLDGSMIVFLPIGGRTFAKTKFSFESDQARSAQELYHRDSDLRQFVDRLLGEDLVPVFEYVSPENRIVVSYRDSELRLLQIRHNDTGEYLDIYRHPLVSLYGIPIAEQHFHTLKEMLDLQKRATGVEGWVVEFTDGQLMKVKTDEYCRLHGLLTKNIGQPNFLVEAVLEERVDDLLGQIPLDRQDIRSHVEQLSGVVVRHVNSLASDIFERVSAFTGDRKLFVERHRDYRCFGLLMRALKDPSIDGVLKCVKDHVGQQTNRPRRAQEYLTHLGFTSSAPLPGEEGEE
jgi:RNA ligase